MALEQRERWRRVVVILHRVEDANLQSLEHRCLLFATRQRGVHLSPGGDCQMEIFPPPNRWVENIHGMNDRLCRPAPTVHLRAEIDVDVKRDRF